VRRGGERREKQKKKDVKSEGFFPFIEDPLWRGVGILSFRFFMTVFVGSFQFHVQIDRLAGWRFGTQTKKGAVARDDNRPCLLSPSLVRGKAGKTGWDLGD